MGAQLLGCSPIDEGFVVDVPVGDFELLFCHGIPLQDRECGDLILITAKSSIYSTKPQKTIHKTRDKNHARRLTAMLHRGDKVSDVAKMLCCARSSVGRWINWFTLYGLEGPLPSGRGRRWPFEHIFALLRQLIKHSPGDFGYQRSRWSTELLAIKINEITRYRLHASTVRRWLPSAEIVWRRAAPRCAFATRIKKRKWPQSPTR